MLTLTCVVGIRNQTSCDWRYGFLFLLSFNPSTFLSILECVPDSPPHKILPCSGTKIERTQI